jgi:uncharacterized protein (TIGR03118 family)
MKAISCTIAALVVLGAACADDDDNQATGDAGTSARDANLTVERKDIASDQSGASKTDKTLVNAWGLAFNPQGAAWVSSNGKGLSEVYKSNGDAAIPAVTIPAPGGSSPSAPTGQVFNPDPNSFGGDIFIFVTEDGSVAGWQLKDQKKAVQRVDKSSDKAIYKGVTIAKKGSSLRLYAADFHNGKIDVFDDGYHDLKTSGDFSDPKLPSGFAPFNVKAVNEMLIVAYAKQDKNKEDDVKGEGNGYVSVFDVDGKFIARLISKGVLNSPWGIAVAPKSFDAAPERLLIGNFGDGSIHVYTTDNLSSTNASVTIDGTIQDSNGAELRIDGLWALEFGNGVGGFAADELYFTAGPSDEKHGVFGRLTSAFATSTNDAGTGGTGTGGSGTSGAGGSSIGY